MGFEYLIMRATLPARESGVLVGKQSGQFDDNFPYFLVKVYPEVSGPPSFLCTLMDRLLCNAGQYGEHADADVCEAVFVVNPGPFRPHVLEAGSSGRSASEVVSFGSSGRQSGKQLSIVNSSPPRLGPGGPSRSQSESARAIDGVAQGDCD